MLRLIPCFDNVNIVINFCNQWTENQKKKMLRQKLHKYWNEKRKEKSKDYDENKQRTKVEFSHPYFIRWIEMFEYNLRRSHRDFKRWRSMKKKVFIELKNFRLVEKSILCETKKKLSITFSIENQLIQFKDSIAWFHNSVFDIHHLGYDFHT